MRTHYLQYRPVSDFEDDPGYFIFASTLIVECYTRAVFVCVRLVLCVCGLLNYLRNKNLLQQYSDWN